MNPYQPLESSSEGLGPELFPDIRVGIRHWAVLAVFTISRACCFGAFVFFTLLEAIGISVNWSNVVPLLGGAFLVIGFLHLTQKHLLHDNFAIWPHPTLAYSLGVLLGIAGATCAQAGII